MNIGNRIKERRKILQMSADELGKKLGKDRSTIYRYENGYIENLPIDMILPIANALNCSPSYLMGWTDEGTNAKSSTIADATLRMKRENTFLECVELLLDLDGEKLTDAIQLLKILSKR